MTRFPNVAGERLSEGHSRNHSAVFQLFAPEHPDAYEWPECSAQQSGLVDPFHEGQPVSLARLVAHPIARNHLESTISESIHQEAVNRAGSNERNKATADLFLVVCPSHNRLGGQHPAGDGVAHSEAPHEILQAACFAYVVAAFVDVVVWKGEVALAPDALDGLAVEFVVLLIPSDGLVEVAAGLLLLAPETGADEADAVDDDEVGIGAWGELVVQLEGDDILVVGVEDFTECDGTGFLGACGDDVAFARVLARLVVDIGAGGDCHALESLIDAVLIGAALDDAEGDPVGFRVSDRVVGMDEVDDSESIGLELIRVEAPASHFVEEICLAGPILDALEISVEARSGVLANFVDVDIVSFAREDDRGGESGESGSEDVDSTGHEAASLRLCLKGCVESHRGAARH